MKANTYIAEYHCVPFGEEEHDGNEQVRVVFERNIRRAVQTKHRRVHPGAKVTTTTFFPDDGGSCFARATTNLHDDARSP